MSSLFDSADSFDGQEPSSYSDSEEGESWEGSTDPESEYKKEERTRFVSSPARSAYYYSVTESSDRRTRYTGYIGGSGPERTSDPKEPVNISDWLKKTPELNFASTISQDRTAGDGQEADQHLSLLAHKLQLAAEKSLPTRAMEEQASSKRWNDPKNSDRGHQGRALPISIVQRRSRTESDDNRRQERRRARITNDSGDEPAQSSDVQNAARSYGKQVSSLSQRLDASSSADSDSDDAQGPMFSQKQMLLLVKKMKNEMRMAGESPTSLEQLLVDDNISDDGIAAKDDQSERQDLSRAAPRHSAVRSTAEREGRPGRSRRKPKFVPPPDEIDWRSYLCSALGVDRMVSDTLLLETARGKGKGHSEPRKSDAYFTILHRVTCKKDQSQVTYNNMPYYLDPASGDGHLSGRGAMANMELYVERHQGLSFIVVRSYVCCNGEKRSRTGSDPVASKEAVSLISRDLCSALKRVSRGSNQSHLYPDFKRGAELPAPYLWFYHDRVFLESAISRLSSVYQQHLRCFFHEYVGVYMNEEYAQVDSELSAGVISSNFLPYIFADNGKLPNEVILQQDPDSSDMYNRAFIQNSWLDMSSVLLIDEDVEGVKRNKERHLSVSISIMGKFWDYDSNFQQSSREVQKQIDAVVGKPLCIQDLPILPLKYADETAYTTLMERGRKFWKYRRMKFVSYTGWDFSRAQHFVDVRFMVDMPTYKKMHSEPSVAKGRKGDGAERMRDDLGPDAMARDEPPSEQFLLLLPPNIYGFNMQEKKWMNLLVQNTSPVVWNNEAFDTLVVDDETKQLIKALVTNKIEASESTDLISGKGNGLIVLLHGGPGTGKTLTAESVAEYAKKPLYRITCGDIGTNPEDVEKYLASVLYLGKTWDCVVLLDEAEVFLQTRDLEDLHRNALVSVFLRVLEYYEGILILTSNRVATFDEAFKSRIQLALHYEPLGKEQRRKVWENFINRLRSFDTNAVNTDDLRRHIDKLAAFDMNGRQIRNAVTTARQLAMFEKKPMDFLVLEHVIEVSSRFDKYLKQVNENLTDEEIARGMQVR